MVDFLKRQTDKLKISSIVTKVISTNLDQKNERDGWIGLTLILSLFTSSQKIFLLDMPFQKSYFAFVQLENDHLTFYEKKSHFQSLFSNWMCFNFLALTLLNIRILTIQLRLVLSTSKHCALKALTAGAKLTPSKMLKKSAN